MTREPDEVRTLDRERFMKAGVTEVATMRSLIARGVDGYRYLEFLEQGVTDHDEMAAASITYGPGYNWCNAQLDPREYVEFRRIGYSNVREMLTDSYANGLGAWRIGEYRAVGVSDLAEMRLLRDHDITAASVDRFRHELGATSVSEIVRLKTAIMPHRGQMDIEIRETLDLLAQVDRKAFPDSQAALVEAYRLHRERERARPSPGITIRHSEDWMDYGEFD